MIDEVFHPYFRKGPLPIMADTFAHGLVERNPRKSIEKFAEYNLGPLIREVLKIFRTQERKTFGGNRKKKN